MGCACNNQDITTEKNNEMEENTIIKVIMI